MTQIETADVAEQALTDRVVASFAGAGSDRYREVMQSLVRHLHGFAREVRLTQEEWETAIEFLTRVGHITDERRQEFILLSDVLGLSIMVLDINTPAGSHDTAVTEATLLGPFFLEDAPEIPLGGDLAQGLEGMPFYVAGTVRSEDGTPLPGARIDAWEADENGRYDVQQPGLVRAGRGWLRAGSNGEYSFWSVRPEAYSTPHDGPVGGLLAAAGRSAMRPAHLHFKVGAAGHRTLVTHVFAAGDPYLGVDASFAVKDSLIVEFTEHDGGTAPDGSQRDGRWARLDFDIVLAREPR